MKLSLIHSRSGNSQTSGHAGTGGCKLGVDSGGFLDMLHDMYEWREIAE